MHAETHSVSCWGLDSCEAYFPVQATWGGGHAASEGHGLTLGTCGSCQDQ